MEGSANSWGGGGEPIFTRPCLKNKESSAKRVYRKRKSADEKLPKQRRPRGKDGAGRFGNLGKIPTQDKRKR